MANTRIWRLSDSQHAHAISDLLGLAQVVEVKTPGTTEDGFVNESELLTVTGAMASQYEFAASDAATQVLSDLEGRVPCPPAEGDQACASAFIDQFVPRAFRRPINDDERAAMLALYREAADEGFAAGIGMVIEATLQASSFLYRTELGSDEAAGPTVSLDPYELAASVSFLLLDSIPDQPLWSAAQDGSLADPAVLAAQVERLMKTPRVQDNLVRIYTRWLGTNRAAGLAKSDQFSQFDEQLARDMVTEAEMFMRDLLANDGTVADLLTSRATFVNERLAALYGIDGIQGESFVAVELPSDQRAGVMTQAAMMSIQAAPEETSVVHRGLVVQELLRCNEMPAPPPGVDLNDPLLEDLDQREMAEHRAQQDSCSTCHALVDPIGLTFEHYDPIGRFRSERDGQAIDASAEVPELGAFEDAVELMEALATDPAVSACITSHMVTYALGRQLRADDRCTLEQLERQVDHAGGSIAEPFRAVALSEAFRLRRREDG